MFEMRETDSDERDRKRREKDGKSMAGTMALLRNTDVEQSGRSTEPSTMPGRERGDRESSARKRAVRARVAARNRSRPGETAEPGCSDRLQFPIGSRREYRLRLPIRVGPTRRATGPNRLFVPACVHTARSCAPTTTWRGVVRGVDSRETKETKGEGVCPLRSTFRARHVHRSGDEVIGKQTSCLSIASLKLCRPS